MLFVLIVDKIYAQQQQQQRQKKKLQSPFFYVENIPELRMMDRFLFVFIIIINI